MSDFLTVSTNANQIVVKVKEWQPRTGRGVRIAMIRALYELNNYIRSQKLSGQVLHVRTGNLRNSVNPYPPDADTFPMQGRVSVDRTAPYGRMLELGTAAHEIVPTRAKALRFMMGGDLIFAMRVRHPGTRPMPFMVPSLTEKRPSIVAAMRAAVSAAVKGT